MAPSEGPILIVPVSHRLPLALPAPPSFGVEISPIDVRDTSEIERAIAAFAGKPNGGLIVLSTSLAVVHREQIIGSAARHRLPEVYPFRIYVNAGGLVSYGPDKNRPLPA